jgi:tetratricopeptide (TPR) repeat protein
MLQTIGIIAGFYNQAGNEKGCEAAYVKYIKLVEKFYLLESLETSSAYFMVGVYYFQIKQNGKALACFMKSLAIRQKKLSRSHPSCSDCLFNMGIVLKNLGYVGKARESFDQALAIR